MNSRRPLLALTLPLALALGVVTSSACATAEKSAVATPATPAPKASDDDDALFATCAPVDGGYRCGKLAMAASDVPDDGETTLSALMTAIATSESQIDGKATGEGEWKPAVDGEARGGKMRLQRADGTWHLVFGVRKLNGFRAAHCTALSDDKAEAERCVRAVNALLRDGPGRLAHKARSTDARERILAHVGLPDGCTRMETEQDVIVGCKDEPGTTNFTLVKAADEDAALERLENSYHQKGEDEGPVRSVRRVKCRVAGENTTCSRVEAMHFQALTGLVSVPDSDNAVLVTCTLDDKGAGAFCPKVIELR